MYSRQQASQLRQSFWTAFGRYMAPVPGAEGQKINWVNYKTGVKYISFTMEATGTSATIAIQLIHPDPDKRKELFQKFKRLEKIFFETVAEHWDWQENATDNSNGKVSVIKKTLSSVNVFSRDDWPAIISFFKPRMIALDTFWLSVKPIFE